MGDKTSGYTLLMTAAVTKRAPLVHMLIQANASLEYPHRVSNPGLPVPVPKGVDV